MSRTITIPATLDEAIQQLNGIAQLLTAKKWERAAIVAAFVTVEHGGDRRSEDFKAGKAALISATEFAALGIYGLTDRDTVADYFHIWMDEVGERPLPGATVELPTVEFPTTEITREEIEKLVERAGLTPEIEYAFDGDYASNEKAADHQSDLLRKGAAMREMVFMFPLAEAEIVGRALQHLSKSWKLTSLRDIVKRALLEAGEREGMVLEAVETSAAEEGGVNPEATADEGAPDPSGLV